MLVRFALWLLRSERLLPEERLANELARRVHADGAFKMTTYASVAGTGPFSWEVTVEWLKPDPIQ